MINRSGKIAQNLASGLKAPPSRLCESASPRRHLKSRVGRGGDEGGDEGGEAGGEPARSEIQAPSPSPPCFNPRESSSRPRPLAVVGVSGSGASKY